METIRDFINKVMWSKEEKPSNYKISYYDRNVDGLVEIPFSRIETVSGSFMAVNMEGKTLNIPLHRIKLITKKGKVVLDRTL